VSEGILDCGLRIADLALRHMAAPSLGHNASLSFVVIGKEQCIGHRVKVLLLPHAQFSWLLTPDSWLLDSLIIE
jgi:hypothetical protein